MRIESSRYAALEAALDRYDQIYLVTECSILDLLLEAETARRKILVLFPETLRGFKEERGGIFFHAICEESVDWLKDLYWTYEFSDRFQILTRSGLHGSILNFLDTGLLSRTETLAVLLNGKLAK